MSTTSNNPQWVSEPVGEHDWHVMPIGDMKAHEPLHTCWCKPVVEQAGLGEIWSHNSADQRELFETGDRKPS